MYGGVFGVQKSLVKGGCRWIIGTGENINIWEQNWLKEGMPLTTPSNIQLFGDIKIVKDLMMINSKSWDLDKIRYQDRHGVSGQWNNIWHAKIPPKVKNLIRRIGRDILPTRKKLISRGVQCPVHCDVCNDGDEDSIHVLFSCTRSIQCWQRAGLWSHISAAWGIWKRRNNKVWDNITDFDQIVVERAKHLITSWRNAQQIRQSANIAQSSPQQTIWIKPRHERYKCNVDASFSLDRNKVRLGMCLRDEHGKFVAARTEWIKPIVEVEIGEAIGLLHALKWVEEMQLHNTDFEMDYKKIVDSLYGKRTYLSDLGSIFNDCRTILASNLVNFDVKFIRRQANEVAHRLAGATTSLTSFHNFITIPTCIYNIIINEIR
ncbi:uncharacterized protein LOC123904565 [Trifolium pratense]|uniref:uncharacterized protein LOC123904565 n=1 Tax=Trifolium pratense TaxID=57577 RepID=UPI001E6982F9|nr:uncharacterized protein LOC123904565 [Trifolium pratense]